MAVAAIGEVSWLRGVLPDDRPLIGVGLITPTRVWSRAHAQIGQYRAIRNVGGRDDGGMDQLGSAVDAEMRLHPEIPLVVLLRLMHLRIARLLGVLG
jgi:hypothetical protein